LKAPLQAAILVKMTRNPKKRTIRSHHSARRAGSGRWPLQDAKAKFSELVRRAKSEGPQLVTVHGREEVVVLSAEEFRQLRGNVTGQALVDMLRASPLREITIAPRRDRLPVRDVDL
jgi:prevent-host-death family protein